MGSYWDHFERNLETLGYFQNLKKYMITLVYSFSVMNNFSDMKLKEWVVSFWKEGRWLLENCWKIQKE